MKWLMTKIPCSATIFCLCQRWRFVFARLVTQASARRSSVQLRFSGTPPSLCIASREKFRQGLLRSPRSSIDAKQIPNPNRTNRMARSVAMKETVDILVWLLEGAERARPNRCTQETSPKSVAVPYASHAKHRQLWCLEDL